MCLGAGNGKVAYCYSCTTLIANLCRVYLRVDRRRLRFLKLDDPLFHMVALTPLSHFLQVIILAMFFCQDPESYFYITFFAEKTQTSRGRLIILPENKNLEDKVLLEGTHFYAGPRFFYDRIVNKIEKLCMGE